MPFDGEFWEERLIRPVDLYPAYRAPWAQNSCPRQATAPTASRRIFVEIESDDGVDRHRRSDPARAGLLIDTELRRYLIGADPLANELIWDTLYRDSVHGRKGVTMMAISAVDCALWDLKGRYFNAPVYRLLGGPTRTEIPAYASALGYSIEPGRAAERAREFVQPGLSAP